MFKYILMVILLVTSSFNVTAKSLAWMEQRSEFLKTHPARNYTLASGSTIADYLTEDYNNVSEDCGSSTRPAFLCNGVMIRAALPGAGYHIWDPSPSAVKTGGVSFSYLRKDNNSTRFVHNEASGLIMYPLFYADDKYSDIDVMCSFPLDADAINRDKKGCGVHTGGYTHSGVCQAQGITTAQGWYKNGTSMSGQCGFDTSDFSSYGSTAKAFMESIKARALLTESQRGEQNEIRLSSWPFGIQDTLPVEAFWYLKGNAQGLNDAQYNQKDFYNSTTNKLIIPIIRITAPTSSSGKFIFEYVSSDQVVR